MISGELRSHPREGEQRLGLRREEESHGGVGVVQLLDAEPVSHQQQFAARDVEEPQPPHPTQGVEAGQPAAGETVQQHFGV